MSNISRSDGSTVPEMTAMKRGQGFRSSFSGRVATIFGCSGALGRYVTNRVGKNGTQMVMPYRCDEYEVLRLKLCGDLGQVLFSEFHLRDEASIHKAIKHSDVVINMIGRDWETRNFTFDEVHHQGPRRLAKCAREAGVKNFIHVSHLLASENPEVLFPFSKGSEFLKSKFRGDMAVLEEFPDATIIRPAECIGTEDKFISYYKAWFRRGKGWKLPLWKKGEYTIKSPVTYTNIADAITIAMEDPQCMGKIYEATGPERYLLYDLVEYMYTIMDIDYEYMQFKIQDLRFNPIPFVKAGVLTNLPFGQRTLHGATLERLERTQLSDISQGFPHISEMGVKLDNMADVLPWNLNPWRVTRYLHGPIDPKNVPLRPIARIEEERIHSEAERSPLKAFGL